MQQATLVSVDPAVVLQLVPTNRGEHLHLNRGGARRLAGLGVERDEQVEAELSGTCLRSGQTDGQAAIVVAADKRPKRIAEASPATGLIGSLLGPLWRATRVALRIRETNGS